VLHLARIEADTGRFIELRTVLVRARRLRSERAGQADTARLARSPTRVSADLAPPFAVVDGALVLRPLRGSARQARPG
jgi:hypothetical protein